MLPPNQNIQRIMTNTKKNMTVNRLTQIIDKITTDTTKDEINSKTGEFRGLQSKLDTQKIVVEQLSKSGMENQIKLEKMKNNVATQHDELLKFMENGMQCEGIQNFDQEMAKLQMAKSRMAQVYELLSEEKIKELYSVTTPPDDCVNLMKCILILLQDEQEDFGWSNARLLLTKKDFKQILQDFDVEKVRQDHIDKLQLLINGQNFNFDAQKKNGACTAYLTEWVNKVVEHHNLYLQLKPYMSQQEKWRKSCDDKQDELQQTYQKCQKQGELLKDIQDNYHKEQEVYSRMQKGGKSLSTKISSEIDTKLIKA